MNTIYLAGYNYGSYEDYTEVNVRAFATAEEAEAFNVVEKAAYELLVSISAKADAEFASWRSLNPFPRYETTVKVPQWPGPRGSKKGADPDILKSFKELENKARDELQKQQEKFTEARDRWEAEGIAEFQRQLVLAGMSEEDAVKYKSMFVYRGEDRDYTVEEVPFGKEEK